jgi:hypothetical protein
VYDFLILIEVTFDFHMAKEFFEDNESRVKGKESLENLVERFDWRKIFQFLV